MKLEYGKKYLRSDFSVSGALTENPSAEMRDAGWLFYDPENSRSYRENGQYFFDRISDLDLVGEWPGKVLRNDGGNTEVQEIQFAAKPSWKWVGMHGKTREGNLVMLSSLGVNHLTWVGDNILLSTDLTGHYKNCHYHDIIEWEKVPESQPKPKKSAITRLDKCRYELASELLLSMAATDAYSEFSADHLAGRAIVMADALLRGFEESV